MLLYLKIAYPVKTPIINAFYLANQNIIKRVWWVRNKQEHIIYTQWPLNAKIFENLNNNPNDSCLAPDNLNFDFIKRVNNLAVDSYKLIIDLQLGQQEQWQYNSIEHFRCV